MLLEEQRCYTYDKTYQLLKTVYPDNKSEEFNYDKAGNREVVKNVKLKMKNDGTTETEETVENYVHNANNEIVSTSSILNSTFYISNYSFDLNGNMTKKTEGANVFEYLYNVENRLSAVKLNGHTLATYAYDPFGRRLWKQVESVKTYFFYTDEGLSAEINNAGEVVKTYGYTPNSIWTTDPLFTREAGQYYFYHNDHLATPQMITSSNGETVWSADYESFGKATVRDGASVTNNLRFPGQYFDGESGLHQNWHREYRPDVGRYGQVDPIGFQGGDANLFRYVLNSPTYLRDPKGRDIYLQQGNNRGGYLNRKFHQSVCVDEWDGCCNKIGKKCYSYGMHSIVVELPWRIPFIKERFIGIPTVWVGEIYEDPYTDGETVKQHKTSCAEDKELLKALQKLEGTLFIYNVFINCRTFSNLVYDGVEGRK